MYTQTYPVWEHRVDFVAVGEAVHKIVHAWLYFAVLGWEMIRTEHCLCNVIRSVSVHCQSLQKFCIHDYFSFSKLQSEYCILKSAVFYLQHSLPQNSFSLLKYFYVEIYGSHTVTDAPRGVTAIAIGETL